MTFEFFFQQTNFSYQYTPKAKAYLESTQTSAIEVLRDFFLQNSQENTGVPF